VAKMHDEKKGTMLEIGMAAFAAVGSIGLLIWLTASNKIVWYSLKPMLAVGSMWKWIPSDFTYGQWNQVVMSASKFARDVSDVSFIDWVFFVNTAATPLTLLVALAYVLALPILLLRKKSSIFRRFTPDQLLEHTVRVFSGVAPVLKIRTKIVNNELPEWRIQVSPEEVFLGNVNGRPMVTKDGFDSSVAQEYFVAVHRTKTIEGRMISGMLGRQIVDLPRDHKRSKSICFPDRLSNEGKAVFALWAAVAFGGEDGKKEYAEYCKRLNLSAYGSPKGLANLTVIQPLYNKYRVNKSAANLFAIHHWENTFLFALLEIAQRRGRYTTAEVLWLRPTNRVMFFALNSCGAKSPHVEAAATFNQLSYERGCYQYKRLPIYRDEEGRWMHVIYVARAVQGLKEEYEHWSISTEGTDEWWIKKDAWKGQDAAMASVLQEYSAKSASSIPKEKPPIEESEFDRDSMAGRAAADANS
jgi:hypothetical protein